MHSCYFCRSPLSKFIDSKNSGNYLRHYCCYECETVGNPLHSLDIWKVPYSIIIDEPESVVSMAYLHFDKLKLWVSVYYWNDIPFAHIRDEDNNHLLNIKQFVNIFDYQPIDLENKIKTYMLFS